MTLPIEVNLLVEGDLDEQVLRAMLKQHDQRCTIKACYGKRGKQDLIEKSGKYLQAARTSSFRCICLVDLDNDACPLALIERCLGKAQHDNFIMRIAVREVEAWLLADREKIAAYFDISQAVIPENPDELPDPKAKIVELARRSRKSEMKRDMVPSEGSSAKTGKNYRARMGSFVDLAWRPAIAADRSPSLRRALARLDEYLNNLAK